MTRQTKAVLGLALTLVLGRPAFADHHEADKKGGSEEKCMGGPEGSKCGGAAQDLEVRVQFDKESAKGEIKCKMGKLKDGKVEYAKCAQDKLDKYEEITLKKKIVSSKDKYDKLDEKKKILAKKLAFYESAVKELKSQLKEMGEDKKEDIEYKKKKGALEKVGKEFDKSLSDCAKEDKEVFTCPAKD